MPSLNVIERRMNRFLRNPASVRGAMGVIVLATALVVVGAGILMRVIDHEEYGSIWVGMWWAVQTVTTVGYGDVTPKDPNGRIVATFVMFEGIAFLAIITAAITSTFVERASRQRQRKEEAEQRRIDTRFDELDRRLDQIEETLRRALSK
jgi:voltage-gated potassium channel Kch